MSACARRKDAEVATILIVDDAAVNREYIVTLLEYSGHKMLQAADGAEALASVKAHRPDLVIADVLMPTMDGFELVRRLRADHSIASTPVIFWTADYHERDAMALAAACGVSMVITKPSEPEAVLAAVAAALGAAAAEQPGRAPAPAFDREHLRLITDKLSQKSDDLAATNLRLSAMVELNLQLASELDPRRLIQSFGYAARQIVGARYSIAAVLDDDGGRFQFVFTSGMDAELEALLGLPDSAAPILRDILRENRPVRLRNSGARPVALGFAASYPPISSWLGVPIASPSRVHGFIGLIDKMGRDEFSEEDERLAMILASQVGRIYQTGTLYGDAINHAADLEREIAARSETERALAEREERIRLLLDSTAEAIYGLDEEGRCSFANAACARMLGYGGPSELVGRHLHALVHHARVSGAPLPESARGAGQTYLNNECTHADDEVFWRTDGSSFPAEYWSHPVCREGRVVGAVVTFLDITQRRRLESDFQQAQRRLREVIVSSPAVLFTLAVTEDRIHKISWISDNVLSVFGYPPEEAVDAAWWFDHIHPDDLEKTQTAANLALFTRGHCAQEYRFRHADGIYRWTRDDMRLIRDAAGRPSEAVGAWLDITERKRSEEEQTSLREQLGQSQKLESVGRLAGGVAHDFNNLLTVINGYSALLEKGLLGNEPLREMAEEIGVAGQRAAELTRQLLLLSRKQVIQAAPVNLNEIVTEVGKMLTRLIGEDILFESALSPNLGLVMADPGQMHQVLMNLAVNARDAMPGGGTLLVETRNVDLDEGYVELHSEVKAGPYVELRVTDSGSGMTKETMSHVFEPFFTTKRVGEGAGLGLATVYGIVKQAGGSIWVYSETGKGASFKILLPRVEASGAAPRPPKPAPTSLRGMETILVVEDQDQLLKITSHILRGYGYRVLEASTPVTRCCNVNVTPAPSTCC